ncbi:MAG: 4'-phosphopantetheinyl transferase superfamily protein, partial [Eubacterium sp.]|nr:4'-phosphopantetheinyl transferase superfamily protein [Eubacterium sp.]
VNTQAIGIDVEAVKPVRDPLIRRVLHEEEMQVLSRFGEIAEKGASGKTDKARDFLRLFFRYWTLKESYLKRDGCGLTKEPREICFTVDPEDWESPVYTSDPDVVCIQKLFTEAHTGEFILSVCVPRGAEKAGLQMVKY